MQNRSNGVTPHLDLLVFRSALLIFLVVVNSTDHVGGQVLHRRRLLRDPGSTRRNSRAVRDTSALTVLRTTSSFVHFLQEETQDVRSVVFARRARLRKNRHAEMISARRMKDRTRGWASSACWFSHLRSSCHRAEARHRWRNTEEKKCRNIEAISLVSPWSKESRSAKASFRMFNSVFMTAAFESLAMEVRCLLLA